MSQHSLQTEELRDSVREFLDQEIALAFDPPRALKAAAERGWLGLCFPDELGGLAQSFAALATIYEELGRRPTALSVSSAIMGAELLAVPLLQRGPGAHKLLSAALSGTLWLVPVTQHAALPVTAGSVLSARFGMQTDVLHATHVWVAIDSPEPLMVLLPANHPGIRITPRVAWDMTRHLADLVFDKVPLIDAVVSLRGDAALVARRRLQTHGDLAIAADSLGGADAALSMTVDYMKERRQFGRPIASFQALKHRCADLCTAHAAAGALLARAVNAFASGDADAKEQAAGSRLLCARVYTRITEEAVQMHGGIGFTFEHRCHVYLKRARLNEMLGASPEQQRDSLAPALFRACQSMAIVPD